MVVVVAICLSGWTVQAQDARPVPTLAWAPKPTALARYTLPQRPWMKLADLRARHKGEPNWREVLVDDGRLTGEYISAAPGTVVSRRFHPDTREWFAVVEGEVKVDIEGQAPLTATRGSLVDIPRQTIYSLETIGDRPSLRFAVNVAHEAPAGVLRVARRRLVDVHVRRVELIVAAGAPVDRDGHPFGSGRRRGRLHILRE